MVGSMKIIRNISYKTVSKAELGLTDGHITHIGYAQNFINNWKKRKINSLSNSQMIQRNYIFIP